jgi:hypothetical protein
MLASLISLRDESREKKRDKLRKGALLAKYGVASSLAAPYDLALTAANVGKQGYNRVTTGEWGEPLLPYGTFSRSFRNAIDENIPGFAVEPQTYGERLAVAGADVLGSGLSAPIKAASSFIPKTARFLSANTPREAAQFAAAGVGSQMAYEAFPDNALAPLLGGIGLSSAVNLPRGLSNSLKKGLKVDPNKIKSFEDAGLGYNLGEVSDSNVVKTIQNIQSYSPFSASTIKKNIDKTAETINKLNTNIDKDITGTNLQNAITKYTDRSRDISTRLKSKVDSYLPPESFVETPKLTQYLEENLAPKDTLSTRKIQEASPTYKYMKDLEFARQQNGGLLRAEDLETFWKEIGDDIGSAVRNGRREEARSLTELQKTLKDDYKGAFKNNPDAQRTFDRYTNFYADYAKKRDGIFNDLTKKVERRENRTISPTGEGAELLREYERSPIESFDKVKRLLIKRPDDVSIVYNTFKPEERRIFNDSVIDLLGQNNSGQFSGDRLAKNFKALPEKARNLITSNLPEATSTKFSALMDAIDNIKSVKELGNSSKTAYYNNYYSLGRQAAAGAGAVGTALAAGKIFGAASGAGALLVPYLASYGTGKLLTSPKFINWAAGAVQQESAKGIEKYFKMLPAIAKGNPELSNDIGKFVEGLDGKALRQQDLVPVEGASEDEIAAAQALIRLRERRQAQ